MAQNVFAHNYDPLGFMKAASDIMDSNSLLFIQTSQADMIKNNEFDTIYHEHISFYNINSMNELCKRSGLNLIDVTKCPLHGNSYIFVVSKEIKRDAHIANLIDMERKDGLLSEQTYIDYANKCIKLIVDVKNAVNRSRSQNFKVVGYGAAAKGMTFLNFAKIAPDFIIDDNTLKQGLYTPGSNVEIVSIDKLDEYSCDDGIMFLPLAWNFFTEIRQRIKDRRNCEVDMFLKYFPTVKVDS